MIMHSHIGFQYAPMNSVRKGAEKEWRWLMWSRSCVVDYFPERKYPKSRKAAKWSLNAATVLVLYGLYEFETNDVGITEGVKRIWKA